MSALTSYQLGEAGPFPASARLGVTQLMPTMMAQAGPVTTLGDLPLYVLTAPVDAQTGWLTPQMARAALSSNSFHLVVAGADRQSLLDNPSAAAMSRRAIVQAVDAARTGSAFT